MGARFGTSFYPDLGCTSTLLLGPRFWNVICKIIQNSSDMNEIILAPCDVISKIKQNSSDMNEIILAPCDAGYVQSCTGLFEKGPQRDARVK
jgi:hypothetical protein